MMGNGYYYIAANIMTFNPNVPERLRGDSLRKVGEKQKGV